MKKVELYAALRELARQNPHLEPYGVWKNPLNPRSRGKRWTLADVELFKKFQAEYR